MNRRADSIGCDGPGRPSFAASLALYLGLFEG